MTDRNHTQTEFTKYRRTQIAEMADWVPGFDMDRVSVSDADKEGGSPKIGDKIARNPANHADRWLVAADYFAVNFEPVDGLRTPAQEPRAQEEPCAANWKLLLRTWVDCPVCGECDMKKEVFTDSSGAEYPIISCSNHVCGSNGGDNFRGHCATPPLAVQGGITEAEREAIRGVECSRGIVTMIPIGYAECLVACVRRLSPATTATGEDFKNALRERAESANTLNDELKNPGLILEPATTATGCETADKSEELDNLSNELKPCPFCGTDPVLDQVDDPEDENHGGYFIECMNPCCMASSQIAFSNGEDCRPELIEKWNHRDPPPAAPSHPRGEGV